MKIRKNKILNIFFSIAILCCFGLVEYSNNNLSSNNITHFVDKVDFDNIFIGDIASFEDDQIIKHFEPNLIDEIICLIPFSNNNFVFLKHSQSIWQPPKVS